MVNIPTYPADSTRLMVNNLTYSADSTRLVVNLPYPADSTRLVVYLPYPADSTPLVVSLRYPGVHHCICLPGTRVYTTVIHLSGTRVVTTVIHLSGTRVGIPPGYTSQVPGWVSFLVYTSQVPGSTPWYISLRWCIPGYISLYASQVVYTWVCTPLW